MSDTILYGGPRGGGMSGTTTIDWWRGAAGNAYIERNGAAADSLRARTALWADILRHTAPAPPGSILEVGANIGLNLRALRALTDAYPYAVEPNDRARHILVRDGVVAKADARADDAAQIDLPDGVVDLAFTCGVLIHIPPDDLLASCKEIHRCARRWIVCIEYFAQKPEMIPYRGEPDRLWKRDYGSFFLDNFPDLRPVACGFAWKRTTGLDDLTWWLLAKETT